jgi:hypothetical protein
MALQLRISGQHHEILKKHLLPMDGREAVAVALCGRHVGIHRILTVHEITLIPHDECYSREWDILCWPTSRIHSYFERIGKSDLALLKIHSHPGGFEKFSKTDDISDAEFFESAFGWSINDGPHASAVMLPEGKIFGRFFFNDMHHEAIDNVLVAGDTIHHYKVINDYIVDEFALRTAQAFGEKTYSVLKGMTVAVVGCSGTGSPLIEQLVRLGVGKIILIDPDVVEMKNLNRILHTSKKTAEEKLAKVDVLKRAIIEMGLGTKVITFQANIYDSKEALHALIECDVIFGCMDSVDGRYLLNQLCSFYLLPYFDLGVKLEADGTGGINKICGSVHYIQPGKSSLLTRGLYTLEDVSAAGQYRRNKDEYENLKKEAYIKNVNVNNPAVISVNMQIASQAVNEFLNRIHPYKAEPIDQYAASTIDISEGYIVNVSERDFQSDNYLRSRIGRGDIIPFLEMPELQ